MELAGKFEVLTALDNSTDMLEKSRAAINQAGDETSDNNNSACAFIDTD